MIRQPTHLQTDDPRFGRLVHPMATLDQLATGFTWTEGPVWIGDHRCLLFSDIPSQRILRWSEAEGVSTFRAGTGFNNGNTRDREGRLVSCRHGHHDVVRTDPGGGLTVLADSHDGGPLNSPNDVVVASDGAVWFTDPTYGLISNFEGYRRPSAQSASHVFRVVPGAAPVPVISTMTQPNGLCFSPDESRLYVADSGRSHDPAVRPEIRVFDVAGQTVTDAGPFAEIDVGFPDGIRTDVEGNLWSSAADGVHCFAPDGTRLGKILVPETVSNIAFGGPNGHLLFITATRSVYAIFVDVKGAEPWTRGAQ